MNPWLSQQLAQARTDDWLRAAEARRRADAARSGHPALAVMPLVVGVRVRVGSVLIRAGKRVAGPGPLGAAA